ncbi:hypothetical protein [Streptomyces sp. NPDC126514]|uniref:hypothetical protein n=1 Tax=Streptomyces sp. NPDC126514 TaxID=3155210 RepID=UPI003323DD72
MEFRDLPDPRDLMEPRTFWVLAGVGAQLLCALVALRYAWHRDISVGTWLVTLAACGACQAVAVAAVLWPGAEAGSREITEGHESATVSVLCLLWIVGVFPAGAVLTLTGHDTDGTEFQAVFLGGTAFMLSSIAGLITAVALADRVRPSDEAGGAPGGSGLPDIDDGGGGGGD